MYVMVFFTVEEDSATDRATGPRAFLEDSPHASLPKHPRSMHWRYFATVPLGDHLFDVERQAIEAAFADGRAYISQRLIMGDGGCRSAHPLPT